VGIAPTVRPTVVHVVVLHGCSSPVFPRFRANESHFIFMRITINNLYRHR
jgi:hypothetical protein